MEQIIDNVTADDATSVSPTCHKPMLGAGASSSDDAFNWQSLSNEKVLIGLSGGINSMAVLCQLVESGVKPRELHLFYAHFLEHSPDTFKFVADGVRFARKHFENVKVKITRNSILKYFESKNMIPHPKVSNCSQTLKIEPISRYAFENQIKIDLVGYVKNEMKTRAKRQQKKMERSLFSLDKIYPIGDYTNEWCFEIVKKHIGWFPLIYDIKENGKPVFAHNNCLPCKNGYVKDIENVKKHFPVEFENAINLSKKLSAYWGRSEADFYTAFGRELGQESTCESCTW
jgi:3'-phosphoadenosine 5'-phosphosulfate sulfotransferase (PAPS reductase)/FAD synthetase